jgi:hypothetical protein
MAELEPPSSMQEAAAAPAAGGGRSQDEVALELMRFIAVTTGYGKSAGSSTGFSGKPAVRAAEEHAEALLELFERCRKVVKRDS